MAGVRTNSSIRAPLAWWLVPVLLFVVFTAITHASFVGDSPDYAIQIAKIAEHQETTADLWEAGHLLWRPLGYAAAPLFVLIPDRVAWTPDLKIYYGLTSINWLSGLAAAILMVALVRRLNRDSALALVIALLFVCGDAVICYSQSATPYVPGMAMLIGGLYWRISASGDKRLSVVGPAILFGLATLFWLPYVMAIPAAACAREFLRPSGTGAPRLSWSRSLAGVTVAGVVVAGALIGAAFLSGVHSVADGKAWLLAAGHGVSQNRQALRAVTGCSRLFIDLGRDGVFFKRFAFHDPYHPVTMFDLFRHSLWKVGVFYIFLGSALWLAWRSKPERDALFPLVTAGIVTLLAEVLIFEPSSPERFLPVLPFLLLGIAAGWKHVRSKTATWLDRVALAGVCGFALLLPVLNLHLLAKSWEFRDLAAAQLAGLQANAAPPDAIFTLTPVEPLEELQLHPFDPLNRGRVVRLFWVIDAVRADAPQWRSRFARVVETSWSNGQAAWVEKAALGDRPDASLLWVEGDNPGLRWADVSSFFRGLEFDAATGAASGFLRISQSVRNQARFRELQGDRAVTEPGLDFGFSSKASPGPSDEHRQE